MTRRLKEYTDVCFLYNIIHNFSSLGPDEESTKFRCSVVPLSRVFCESFSLSIEWNCVH